MEKSNSALRAHSIKSRKAFTDALKSRGAKPREYADLTDRLYRRVLGSNTSGLRKKYGISRSVPLRDAMPQNDLQRVSQAELSVASVLNNEDVSVTTAIDHVAVTRVTFIGN